MDYTADATTHVIELEMEVTPVSGTSYTRTLRIESPTTGSSWDFTGGKTTLLSGGSELVSYQFDWNTGKDPEVRITERVSEAILEIETKINEGDTPAYTQIYTMGGKTFTVEFPEYDIETIKESWAEYELDPDKTQEELSALPYGEEIAEFDDFYEWKSSLNDNPDGELLTRLTFSDELGDWMNTEEDIVNAEQPTFECFAAVQCVLFKCFAGGPVNSICIACAMGAAIICN